MDLSRFLDALRQGCVDPHFASKYHKDAPSAPATPDYPGAARATAAGTVQASIANNMMAHPNIYTPLGSQTWNQTGMQTIPGADGNSPVDIPTYRQDISMTPAGQSLYDQQTGLSTGLMGLGQGALDRTGGTLGRGLDTSGMPSLAGGLNSGPVQGQIGGYGPVQGSLNGDTFDRKHVEDALYGRATARLDPQWAQSGQSYAAKLADQGIPVGSEAHTNAMREFNAAKNDAYSSARNDSIAAGGAEASRQFGIQQGMGQFANAAQAQQYAQGLGAGQFANAAQAQAFGQQGQAGAFQNQARTQALQEMLAQRQLPLSELNAIRTGAQPNMPQFQPTQYAMGAQGPNMSGAAQATGTYNQGLYNQQMAGQNAFTGGLMGMAGTLGGAYLGMPSGAGVPFYGMGAAPY